MAKSETQFTAFIPVRGGSKGIPRKNEALLGGKPLMAWSILVAKMTPRINNIVVSTDDDALAAIAEDYGAQVVKRPDTLAKDDVRLFEVILNYRDSHLNKSTNRECMILLEATSPFRSPELLIHAIEALESGFDSAATFKKAESHPTQCWEIDKEKNLSTYIQDANPWVRRQELPPVFELSGDLYAFDLNLLKTDLPSLLVGRSVPIIVDHKYSIDINEPRDMELAKILFAKSPLATLPKVTS